MTRFAQHIKFLSPDGPVAFRATDSTARVLRAYQDNRFNIAPYENGPDLPVPISCGIAFMLWTAIFQQDRTILLCSNTFGSSLQRIDQIRFAHENLPDHVRAGVAEYNKSSIVFDNGSRIVGRATTPDAARGMGISLLFVDRFALSNRNTQKEFWNAVRPCLAVGSGKCTLTGYFVEGKGDLFREIWDDSQESRFDFNAVGSVQTMVTY